VLAQTVGYVEISENLQLVNLGVARLSTLGPPVYTYETDGGTTGPTLLAGRTELYIDSLYPDSLLTVNSQAYPDISFPNLTTVKDNVQIINGVKYIGLGIEADGFQFPALSHVTDSILIEGYITL
jgi:hypothetical protein